VARADDARADELAIVVEIEAIVKRLRDAAAKDNRFSAIVLGIVKSPAFQMRVSASE
jgi:hypothetical protein